MCWVVLTRVVLGSRVVSSCWLTIGCTALVVMQGFKVRTSFLRPFVWQIQQNMLWLLLLHTIEEVYKNFLLYRYLKHFPCLQLRNKSIYIISIYLSTYLSSVGKILVLPNILFNKVQLYLHLIGIVISWLEDWSCSHQSVSMYSGVSFFCSFWSRWYKRERDERCSSFFFF
jgi:hypothetical protein